MHTAERSDRRRPACRLLAVAASWFFLLSFLLAAEACAAEAAIGGSTGRAPSECQRPCNAFRVRQQDQIWVVSTRALGCPAGGKELPAWQIWRLEKGWWQPAATADFYAADSADLVTPIYIHGNRYEHFEALQEGLRVYFQLAGKFDDEPPVRFVIWSWPSSQIHGPLKDVRAKAARSDIDAYYLARFLAGMSAEVRVGLVGFSYGPRIISGALHLCGGGVLLGQTIEPGARPQFRAVLWAAAEHNHWYLPSAPHDRALAVADAWLITINCCDSVLSRYRFIDKCSHPSAVGYAGIYRRNLLPPEVNDRIEEVNVSHLIGDTHTAPPYIDSRYIQNRTRQYALWHEPDTGDSKPAESTALAAVK